LDNIARGLIKRKFSKKHAIYGTIIVFLILLALSGTLMSQVNEPKYQVIDAQNNIEVRQYAPIIIAQVSILGERKKAISAGFRILADYIFGNNETSKEISMMAPVEQQAGEKISMTAPVIQQGLKENQHWNIRFIMPSEYTLETLPRPKNNQIEIMSIPSKRYVVIRFSGLARNAALEKYTKKLLNYTVKEKMHTIGKPLFAFYNPPWTLPFLRRNEIMFELK
jgi:effector-binding domain-containing protein